MHVYRGRRLGFGVGRLNVFLWAGSWTWWARVCCPHCKNLYVGPFGVEWLS